MFLCYSTVQSFGTGEFKVRKVDHIFRWVAGLAINFNGDSDAESMMDAVVLSQTMRNDEIED